MFNAESNKTHVDKLDQIIQQLEIRVAQLDFNKFNSIENEISFQYKQNNDTEYNSNVKNILEKYKNKNLDKLKEQLDKIKKISDSLQKNIESTNKTLSDIVELIRGIKIILENQDFQKSHRKSYNKIKTQYQEIQELLVKKIQTTKAYTEFPIDEKRKGYHGDKANNSAIIDWFFNEVLEYHRTNPLYSELSLKDEKKTSSIGLDEICQRLQSVKLEKYEPPTEDDGEYTLKLLRCNEKDKEKIEKQYNGIKDQIKQTRTEEEITDENKKEIAEKIYNWAIGIKNGQNTPTITDEKFLKEAICMMDQAYRLSTGKHRLKKTQIIALLIFMQLDDDCKGRLCQILTGEGKTTVVSLLAVITSLCGKKVDIITSDPVLAKKGVEEKELFYNLFGLSCAHNTDISDAVSRENNPYKADILYGTISSFHFDYLRHYFKLEDVRADRPLDFIILDEIDNILIDNGSHSTRISEPMPGLDSLKYRYLNIWLSLKKALQSFSREEVEKHQKYARHNSFNFDVENKESLHYDFLKNLIEKTEKEYETHTEKTKNLSEITPNFLEKYVKKQQQEKIWIKNAIMAAFHYHQDRDYKIAEEKGYKCIQPVDSRNTGITLNNTILSDGLHQFLEIKHNLYLSVENLESNYISNIDYVGLYSNIFGLTGTLGSENEQTFLQTCYREYNLKFAEIPPSREKQFVGPDRYCIAKDEGSWVQEIINRILKVTKNNLEDLEFTDCKNTEELDSHSSKNLLGGSQNTQNQQGQPILVVFEFIEEAQFIYEQLLELGCENVILCDNEEAAKNVEREELKPGSIVIATNIAGRGTDFKVDDAVDELGGLHVCLTFLPYNERIEKQAFGRTARNGNKGSGELIINKDTLPTNIQTIIHENFSHNSSENSITLDENLVEKVKEERNKIEEARIEKLLKEQLPKIKQDYNKFKSFCSKMPAIRAKYPKYIVKDIEMRFAFFIKNSLPGNDCDDIDSFIDGCLKETSNNYSFFNPYYAVNHANYLIEIGEQEEAIELLKKITNSSNYKLLYQAHMKLFEAILQKFSGIWNRLYETPVIGSVISVLGINNIDKKQYKQDVNTSKHHLDQARKYIEIETSIITDFEEEDIFFIEEETEQTPLGDSVFLKKMILQDIYLSNINSLLKDIQKHEAKENNFYLSAANKISSEHIDSELLSLSLKEMKASGLDNFYELKECKNVKQIIADNTPSIEAMKIDLAIAASLLGIGFIFPVCGVVAINRMVDIFIDFLMLVVFERSYPNDLVNKLIDYGLATLNGVVISKLLKCQKFLNKSLRLTQTVIQESTKHLIRAAFATMITSKIIKYRLMREPSIVPNKQLKGRVRPDIVLPDIKKNKNEELEEEAKKRYDTKKPSEEPDIASSTNASDVPFEPGTYTPEVDEIPTNQTIKDKSSSSSSSNNSKSNSKNQPSRKLIPEKAEQIAGNKNARPKPQEQKDMIDALNRWNFCDLFPKKHCTRANPQEFRSYEKEPNEGFRLEIVEGDKNCVEIQNNSYKSDTTVANVHWINSNGDSLQQFIDKEGEYQKYGKNQDQKVNDRVQRINNNAREALKRALENNLKLYINLEDFNQVESQFKEKLNKLTKKISPATETINGGREINLNSNNIISDLKYWMDYNSEVLMQLLRLRLASSLSYEILEQVVLIKPLLLHNSTSATNCVNTLLDEVVKRRYLNYRNKYILIPISFAINSFLYHWVGLVLKINHGLLEICYIDSTNQEMDVELKSIILKELSKISNNYTYKQMLVENQKDYNCGPELIENFIYYLTNVRATQESSVYLHSLLYENTLLDQSASELQIQKNSKFIDLLSKQVPVDEVYFYEGLPVISKNLLFLQQYGDSLQSDYLEEPEMSEKKGLIFSHKLLL